MARLCLLLALSSMASMEISCSFPLKKKKEKERNNERKRKRVVFESGSESKEWKSGRVKSEEFLGVKRKGMKGAGDK